MVNTQILGVALTPTGGIYSEGSINFNNIIWSVNGANFSVDTGTSDKYFTRLLLYGELDIENNKTIALSSATLNYARIKPISLKDFGTWTNGTGGTFGNEASGTLTLSPNAIATTGTAISPGYYSPDLKAEVNIGYLSPLSPEFGISSPGYPVGDMDGQRWYLSSAGIFDVNLGSNTSADPIYSFYSTFTGTLKMPIAAVLTAPDSIPYWHLTAGKWTKSGMAYKSGSNYIVNIHEFGVFNFATPVQGAYTTLQFKSGGIPLINATFRIKADNIVLFEGQTDWDGKALAFLPSGIAASVEIHYTGAAASGIDNSIPAGTITTTAQASTLTINVTSPSLICTISGVARNCDGSPINNGKVILNNTYLKEVWHLPVVNGTINAAIVDGSYEPMIYTLTAVNTDAHVTGTDTAVAIAAGSSNIYTLNTCPAITALYMNYTVDGVSESITSTRSDPQNSLVAFQSQDHFETIVTSGSTGKGLQFSTYAFSPGVYIGSGISLFSVDGHAYNYNPGKPMRVTFDRYDLLSGGLIAGSADFYYDDSSGVTHHVSCSFRVVRL
jgi:hypothetical protein